MVKNNTIYIWRIVFTYIIAIYHLLNAYNIVGGWYIGVEFFFIVSGFLLMMKVDENKITSPWKYTFERFLYFVPICFLGGISRLIYSSFLDGSNLFGFLYQCFESIPDFLLVYLFGGSDSLNPVVWYINALLACGVIILYLLLHHRRFYLNILAPFSALLIYGWCVKYSGCIEGFGAWDSPYKDWSNYLFLLRGFAGLSVGVLVYVAVQECQRIIKKNWQWKLGATSVEILGYLGVLVLSFYYGRSNLDVGFVVILALCVGLSFMNECPKWLIYNPAVSCLNNISIYVYINHYLVRMVFCDYLAFSVGNLILYCVIITIVALVEYLIIEGLKKCIKGRRT